MTRSYNEDNLNISAPNPDNITTSSRDLFIYNSDSSGNSGTVITDTCPPENQQDCYGKFSPSSGEHHIIEPSRIIIIGTAHVSEKSVAEVNEAIEREKPDIVAVELCKPRYDSLKGKTTDTDVPIKEILKGGKIYQYMIHMLLAHVQKKFADEMGVQPGAEMIKAIDAAEEHGARIALIDRDVQVTLQRFWNKMGFIEKLKMLAGLVAAVLGIGGTKDIDMDTITNQDIVTMLVEEFRGTSPNAVKVLIDERDAYMASNLIRLASGGGKKIIAVVGAGHRAGIQNYLIHPETLPRPESVEAIPKKRFSFFKIFGLIMLAIPLGAFALLLISGVSLKTLGIVFIWWFLITGGLSALGTALARGHPYSILTSFLVAWMTTLNPAVAAGWYAGLREAKYRNPTTRDLKNLVEAESMKDMMKNNFFRVLLVTSLANLGAMVGSIVGAYVILQILGIEAKDFLESALRAGLAVLGL
ncbi:pheromone shutdown-related protein TraB [Methanomethylovorans hollandica DSM 15978]|uniref:Pheromone shutdown-related protein TraB n=1 Tax=Methanomethylovorans hollandica (strain DSM 15978 / NBRC 107637 / DMS1) TaxID=867904 RepID=L0L2R7_METHD|nr:TraB/GumN family protein [Methanomethylovorans hollandica]AGB50599.1 pheromone shutdown-related protein TraB [Methanomethylovorans hollandica DSM 15978]